MAAEEEPIPFQRASAVKNYGNSLILHLSSGQLIELEGSR